MKNTKDTENTAAETARKKLNEEKARVDQERANIESRIEELKQLRVKKENYNKGVLPSKSFNITEIENQTGDLALTPEQITEKIWLLTRALKNDYLIDDGYRAAAKEYVDSITELVNELDDKKSECVEKISKIRQEAKTITEAMNGEIDNITNATVNLFGHLDSGADAWCLSGPYVLKRIREKINRHEAVIQS